MGEFFRQLIDGGKKIFGDMTASQKVTMLTLAAAVVISLVLMMVWAGQKNYVAVASDLAGEQLQKTTARLKEAGVDVKQSADGKALMVPQTQADRARGMILSEGLLPGKQVRFGYEQMLKVDKLSVTDAERRSMERIALQTELAKTIETLSGIERAEVQISEPSPRIFVAPVPERKASVTVTPAGAEAVSKKTMYAIVHLVANAVQDLSPKNVVVVDAKTSTKYQMPDAESELSLVEQRDDLEEKRAAKFEEDIRALFDARGYAGVQAAVNIVYDIERRQTETNELDPNDKGTVAVEVYKTLEDDKSTGPTSGDVGAAPEMSMSRGSGGSSQNNIHRVTTKTKSVVSSKHDVVTKVQRAITAITATIAVPTRRIVERDEAGESKVIRQAMSPQDKEELTAAVKNTLNLRGESAPASVVITAMPDVELADMAAEVAAATRPSVFDRFWSRYGPASVLSALALVSLALLYFMARRATYEEVVIPPAEAHSEMPALEEAETLPPLRSRQVQARVKELVEDDPKKAATIVKRWILRDT